MTTSLCTPTYSVCTYISYHWEGVILLPMRGRGPSQLLLLCLPVSCFESRGRWRERERGTWMKWTPLVEIVSARETSSGGLVKPSNGGMGSTDVARITFRQRCPHRSRASTIQGAGFFITKGRDICPKRAGARSADGSARGTSYPTSEGSRYRLETGVARKQRGTGEQKSRLCLRHETKPRKRDLLRRTHFHLT